MTISPHAPDFRRILSAVARIAACAGLVWVSATPAMAQPQGGGDRSGDRGRDDGGRRSFDPSEMVSRLDQNQNGQLDPDEMQGRARFFLEGVARDNNLDLSKPIPVGKLRELMQARFQQMSGGRGGPGGGNNGGGQGSNGSGTNTAATKPTTTIAKNAFGVEQKLTPVPGFGTETNSDSWDAIKAKYDERVVGRVEEMLNRMDKNKDGILDAEEIKNGQWRGDPKESDTNKDGKLSRSELAERQRLRDQNGNGGGFNGGRPSFGGGFPGGGFPGGGFNGGGSFNGGGFNGGGFNGGPPGGSSMNRATPSTSGPSSSSSGPSSSGGAPSVGSSSNGSSSNTGYSRPSTPSTGPAGSTSAPSAAGSAASSGAASQFAGYADGLLKQYDTNKDGTLQRDEWSQMSSKRQKADANGDGLITRDEIITQLSDYAKASGASTSSSSSGASASTVTYGARAASTKGIKTYRFLAPVERLPSGLPDWFTRSDANGDGQVSMSEFSSAWDDAKAAEFAQWDRNGDGLVTSREAANTK